MTIKPIYRFIREDGGVTVSPNKPDVDYTEKIRLIADEGKVLTKDGINTYGCIDVDSVDGWYEIEDPTFNAEDPVDL